MADEAKQSEFDVPGARFCRHGLYWGQEEAVHSYLSVVPCARSAKLPKAYCLKEGENRNPMRWPNNGNILVIAFGLVIC